MTWERKWAQVSDSPRTSDEQLEMSQGSTELTLTPEMASSQFSYGEKDTPHEPDQMPPSEAVPQR